MVSIKGVDDMVPKATGKAQFLVLQMKLMAPVGRSLVFSGCIVQDISVL